MIRRAVAALVGVLGLLALAGCGSSGTGGQGYVAGDGTMTIVPVAERSKIDSIEGTTLDGKKISLADFAGKPVVVNVWGSWCPPCRAEAPRLQAAHENFGDKVGFLGINVRDPGSEDNPKAYVRRFKITYPNIYDPTGKTLKDLRGKITAYTIPSTLIIDSEGRVGAIILGEVPGGISLQQMIDQVEKGSAA